MNLTTVSLSSLADVCSGGSAPQNEADFSDTGYPFVRAGSLRKLLDGADEDSLEKIEPHVAKQHGLKLFPIGTVLFAKSGMSATMGYIHSLRKPAFVVNHLAALVPHDPQDSAFLLRALEKYSPTRLIKDPAYPSIRLGDIEEMPIRAPANQQERARIATILNSADALRVKRRAALAKLDTLAQSIFIEMFGDPVTNPKRWPVGLIEQNTTKIGSGATPTGGESAYKQHGISLIRSMNVRDGLFLRDGLAFIDEDQARRLDNVVVEADDVLLNITGASVARVCRAPKWVLPARVNQHVAIIRPRATLSPEFLEQQLLSAAMKRKLLQIGEAGATRQAITKSQIEKLQVILPPLTMQQDFARQVERLMTTRQNALSAEAQLEILFLSLQHRAFRGEL